MVPEPQRQLTINTNKTFDSANYHQMHSVSHNEEHLLSANGLATKLEKLKVEQERCKAMNHDHHHHRLTSQHSTKGTLQIDQDLQKRAQETIHEILERLEHQKHESEFSTFAPGVEDNGGISGRARHTYALNPDLLKDTIYARSSLRQSHGNANLRHG
ncbi:hypothetical protein BGZ80_000839 [Entomortierella chlamydospora]|uniref:Uncharacterized protein n=1 Tax=Entomortierella chlamydospora TaxID=101097 RepID=A0A9P6MSN8_9FUNG|nr:hypothetical protein BGZ79_000546 [Entomortierella chlamydospora]KAG0011225.1 hypothetical protein BGZ80_000839 [Entomortierella chlamydospora]